MPTHRAGRHELGQNFLIDPAVIDSVVDLVARTDGPIIEIGSGAGALTLPLQRLTRSITAVEIDERLVRTLRRDVDPDTTHVVVDDFLRYRLPATPHVVVGNLPFHQTTAMLRRLLRADGWSSAVLIVQWEVARRRAGVGGATMMTAQWWPWFEFGLAGRVPATAFSPRPGVDGGLLTIVRRDSPLLAAEQRSRYAAFVHAVFTGRGRTLREIVVGVAGRRTRPRVDSWLARQRFRTAKPLPRDLTAAQWAELFALASRRPE